MTDSVNTDQSDGSEMEWWRKGNVTYSVNQPELVAITVFVLPTYPWFEVPTVKLLGM